MDPLTDEVGRLYVFVSLVVSVFVSVSVFEFVFMQSGLSHVEEVGGLCRAGRSLEESNSGFGFGPRYFPPPAPLHL